MIRTRNENYNWDHSKDGNQQEHGGCKISCALITIEKQTLCGTQNNGRGNNNNMVNKSTFSNVWISALKSLVCVDVVVDSRSILSSSDPECLMSNEELVVDNIGELDS